ncbi:MAG: acylphosphatase [Ignisphaera sp.]|uniref:Acylphosphatase-like domain-containing protein n=1 Tax=Ignisphaera aggregans TaxID=334771 RepID=A0A7J3JPN7_9CREN
MKTVKIIVRGVLRGTGFKAHIYLLAKKLRLRGYIVDEDEDRELICIEGEEAQVDEFLKNIDRGPPFTLINSIIVLEAKESCNTPTFEAYYREF